MPMKPFRPPLIRRLENTQQQNPKPQPPQQDVKARLTANEEVPSSKRRRINGKNDSTVFDLEDSGYATAASTSEKQLPERRVVASPSKSRSEKLPFKKLSVVKTPLLDLTRNEPQNGSYGASSTVGNDDEVYYNVLWRKFTTKKNKTWDGDGILTVSRGYVSLQDISGKSLGRTMFNEPLFAGSTLSIGGKDVEIECEMSKKDYLSGRAFLSNNAKAADTKPEPNPERREFKTPLTRENPKKSLSALLANVKARQQADFDNLDRKPLNNAANTSIATQSAFKNPLKNSTVLESKNRNEPTPRHDPNAPGAVIMKRPHKAPTGKQIVDVVVDPLLGKHLRDHQKEGVKFMYECVMNMRPFEGEGCILADEMGLGKTLQTITLLWTLLKQNPIYGANPVVKKALIVCPVTLINNWRKEFRKWLGSDRIGVFVADGTKTRFTDFTMGKSYSVMIIGYERLRSVQEELSKGAGIDIVIADEGHRLKTVQNKSAQAIQSLNTPRRVILSGTPIQNDLTEFFAMVDFINPGLLGTFKTFMREFEGPIVKSRQPNACRKDIEKGRARSEELAQLSSQFILRRTAALLEKYLPPKTEYVLFCNPTPTQASIYRLIIQSPMFQCALGSSESALQLITILKKLCNSPSLLNPNQEEKQSASSLSNLIESLPSGITRHFTPGASGKIRVLDQFLYNLNSMTDEKVVLVSNYTSTLNALSTLLSSLGLPFLRLDGSTPASKRQGLVDDFNRSSSKACFAFLLSAKAGGIGLNLIGASRLILFDVDWNPATDMQAMARIHRDGQKRHCRIYRFVLRGALEEKIWQRQITKVGLADSVMDHKAGVATFSREELRDLFRLDETVTCQTHDLLGCDCGGRGQKPSTSLDMAADSDLDDLSESDEELDEDAGSDSDDEFSDPVKLVKASKVSEEHINPTSKQSKRREAAKNQALMQYRHIDPKLLFHDDLDVGASQDQDTDDYEGTDGSSARTELEKNIDDDVLFSLLKENGSGVGYLFKKRGLSGD
ncbi:helicase [Ascosphaera pollenicola]|nr:helicase [Ascosphaera pollenicola]